MLHRFKKKVLQWGWIRAQTTTYTSEYIHQNIFTLKQIYIYTYSCKDIELQHILDLYHDQTNTIRIQKCKLIKLNLL